MRNRTLKLQQPYLHAVPNSPRTMVKDTVLDESNWMLLATLTQASTTLFSLLDVKTLSVKISSTAARK